MKRTKRKSTNTSPLYRGKGDSPFADPRRTFFSPGYPSEGGLPVGWLGDFTAYGARKVLRSPGKHDL